MHGNFQNAMAAGVAIRPSFGIEYMLWRFGTVTAKRIEQERLGMIAVLRNRDVVMSGAQTIPHRSAGAHRFSGNESVIPIQAGASAIEQVAGYRICHRKGDPGMATTGGIAGIQNVTWPSWRSMPAGGDQRKQIQSCNHKEKLISNEFHGC